jgi:adenine-specific DNA-methyltransferase
VHNRQQEESQDKASSFSPTHKADYILWFAKDKQRARSRIAKLYLPIPREKLAETFSYVELPDGRELTLTELGKETGFDYRQAIDQLGKDFPGAKLFASENLTSGGFRRTQSVKYTAFRDIPYDPGIEKGNCWKHSAITDDGTPSGLDRLAKSNRPFVGEKQLRFKRYAADFGFTEVTNWWDEFGGAPNPIYAVQTNSEVVKRCILMTTEPGDLVLDPTCGSGTMAYCAEQWGRRWITIDTSRVPLALARQRLLTATFDWYELNDETRGPAGGFAYVRKQNRKGEQTGGIVPHVTSSTIANEEPPAEEVLVDRPHRVHRPVNTARGDSLHIHASFTAPKIGRNEMCPAPRTRSTSGAAAGRGALRDAAASQHKRLPASNHVSQNVPNCPKIGGS